MRCLNTTGVHTYLYIEMCIYIENGALNLINYKKKFNKKYIPGI